MRNELFQASLKRGNQEKEQIAAFTSFVNNDVQMCIRDSYMANFIAHIAKKLPDDVIAKLTELRDKEDSPLSKTIYDTMFENQRLAVELNRPSCQDTGVLQFWVKCGTKFPLIDELEGLLKEAVVKATFKAPLRHNSVETVSYTHLRCQCHGIRF